MFVYIPCFLTVIRNPRLYPPSPRSSISNSPNVDRFTSLRSSFSSFAMRLLQGVSGSPVTPEASPAITRNASPIIVEVESHNKLCRVNTQLQNIYHNRGVETDGAETDRTETPPPAYPGIIGADITEITPSRLDIGVSPGSPRRHSWNGWVSSSSGSPAPQEGSCYARDIRRRPSFLETANRRNNTHLELELEPASPPPEYPFHEVNIHCFDEQVLRDRENASNAHLRDHSVTQCDNSLHTHSEELDATSACSSNHGYVTSSFRCSEEDRQNGSSQQYPPTLTFKGLGHTHPSSS